MEQNSQENKDKFINPEFRDMNIEVKNQIEIVNKRIDVLLDDVRYNLGVLQRYEYEKGYMDKRNTQIENNREWAQHSGETPFTNEDYNVLQLEVEATAKLIQETKDVIAEMHMYKAFFQVQLEAIASLEQEFKEALLKINPEQGQ